MSLDDFDQGWDQIDWRYGVLALAFTAGGIVIWLLGIWKAAELAWWLL